MLKTVMAFKMVEASWTAAVRRTDGSGVRPLGCEIGRNVKRETEDNREEREL